MKNKGLSREEKIGLYTKMVKSNPDAELKGDTIPYTSVNGNMYSYFSKDGIVALRLSEEHRNELMKKHKASLMVAYGITQKEYVAIPETLLQNAKDLEKYFDFSFNYACSLKAKPTKKAK
jgi:hypothetical protein